MTGKASEATSGRPAALPPGSTIGFLGGGQLARMMGMAALRLGYVTSVLDPDESCPAYTVAGVLFLAPYDDERNLGHLAGAHVVTYEFENVPAASAERLAAITRLAPPAEALAVSQDRLVEKRHIEKLGLPVASHAAVDDAAALAAARERLEAVVLKTRRFGYDGKGQRVIAADADEAEANDALASLGTTGLIAERLVPLDAELSVIVVRAMDGRSVTFDPARNWHAGGILRRSVVPSGLGAALEGEAREAAIRIAESLDYVGAMGVEFFVSEGRLLVNEIAPRVHNSGHWTEAACAIDQFEAHVRAIAGLPVGDGSRHSDAVMENLIGEDVGMAERLASEPDIRVHLYGKHEVRAGRKMGHATRIAPRGQGARPVGVWSGPTSD